MKASASTSPLPSQSPQRSLPSDAPAAGDAGAGARLSLDARPAATSTCRPRCRAPRPLTLPTLPQTVTLDLARTAILIIDMQNDFCARGGWVDHLGLDYTPDRAPIAPLQRLLPSLRRAGVSVIWVNWGNRPDLANMPPNQIHLYKPQRQRGGPRRSAARLGRARLAKGQLGRRDRRRAAPRARATCASTSTASAASGTRRSTASCATCRSARSCSRA